MSEPTPQFIDEHNVWTAQSFSSAADWQEHLSPEMVEEITHSLNHAMACGIVPQQVGPDTFPLTVTQPLLDRIANSLEHGRGFCLLRGWPAHRFTYEQNVMAFCGIASRFGECKIQNYEGQAIVDVLDNNRPYDHTSRGYMSNKHLPFHSDGADIVGLLCLGVPATGGTSVLVSATHIYNTIVQEAPRHLQRLKRGFFHHRRGQHTPGESPVSSHRIPVFSFHDQLLHCCYNRNPIDWVVHEGLSLTKDEVKTLDFFDELCNRPGVQVEMTFQHGDMQFVNNFVILHSRGEYRDDSQHKRHLVRLWLENPNGRRSAPGLLDLYVPGSSKVTAKAMSD